MNQPRSDGNNGKRVVGYVRTAGEGQGDSYALDAQKQEIERWCREHGYDLQEFYSEEGPASGNTIEGRPVLKQLLEDSTSGRFDTVVVVTVDRWARNFSLLRQIVDALNGAGIKMTSLADELDLTAPVGRMMLAVSEAFEQHTREQLRRRQARHV